jgi:hypothetical protein
MVKGRYVQCSSSSVDCASAHVQVGARAGVGKPGTYLDQQLWCLRQQCQAVRPKKTDSCWDGETQTSHT